MATSVEIGKLNLKIYVEIQRTKSIKEKLKDAQCWKTLTNRSKNQTRKPQL